MQVTSVARRPSWGQVAIMFVCTIPVMAIVARIATAAPLVVGTRDLAMVSAGGAAFSGWPLSELIAPYLPPAGWFNFRAMYIAFVSNFVYWFLWIFSFVPRSDKRWRRKRAVRIDA